MEEQVRRDVGAEAKRLKALERENAELKRLDIREYSHTAATPPRIELQHLGTFRRFAA